MEMNKKTIKEYFDLIQSNVKSDGYFLNINRYLKSTVGEDIKFDEYPYDNLWNVEISKKSFFLKFVEDFKKQSMYSRSSDFVTKRLKKTGA